jgi:phosphatidate cytidylyltransferase
MSEVGEHKAKSGRSWSDLGPRLISAAVLIALAIGSIFLGGVWFALVVGAVFAGVYREWEVMVTGKPVGLIGYGLMGALIVSGALFPFYGIFSSMAVLLVAALAALLTPSAARWWRAGGVVYLCLVVLAILAMRGTTNLGIVAGFYVGFAVWLTDSGAFFTGRLFGGAKLSPDISPSKTWSGALGGLATGAIGATIFWAFMTDSPVWIGLVIALVLSLCGQLGDLAESAVKRRFRIKDSGDLIPGHGGLMDRLDSLSFAVLVMFLIGAIHANVKSIAEGLLLW